MPKKIRELKKLLRQAGFTYRSAKGSHTRWVHPLLPSEPITIAGKDGDDAKPYLEKEVTRKLEMLNKIKQQDSES